MRGVAEAAAGPIRPIYSARLALQLACVAVVLFVLLGLAFYKPSSMCQKSGHCNWLVIHQNKLVFTLLILIITMMSLSAFLRSTFPQYGSFRVASRGVSSFGTIRKIPFGSNRGTVSSPVRFTNLSGASTRGDLRSQFGSTSSSLVPVLLSLRAGSNGTNGQFRLRSSRSESGHPAEREKPESSDFNNSSAPIDWNHALNLIIKAKANLANQVETASPMVSTQFPELKDLAIQLSEHFARGGKIPMNIMNAILDVSILRHETLPNVIPIFRSVCNTTTGERGSVIVVGDTHGQYLDFYQIIQDQLAGTPSDNNRFVINGDIVDRGTMSIEILTVLLTLKLACDSSVTILRGNHETTMMNKHYGFEKEVLFKFERNRDILAKFRLLFDTLPLAAVIENSLFVVHGGLGQQTANMTISDLNKLDRQTDANEDTISELLWGGK